MKNKISFYESGSIEILYARSSHCFPLHSHESFCIGLVVDGQVDFEIDNKKKSLRKNMMFIIPSNTSILINTESEYKYITICIKNKLKDKLNSTNFSDYFLNIDNSSSVISICDKFKKDNDENYFIDSLLKIIDKVIIKENIPKNDTENDIVPKICSYIINHADDKFDLDILANKFFISKYHLIRIFKNSMGVTPKQYHTQAKIRLLKSQILKNKSETSLAINLNMTDSSHMCKIFKKYMGISIKSYQKNYTHR